MRRLASAPLALIGLVCAGQPALSQPASAGATSEAAFARALREYASCMALAVPDKAVKLLRTEPGTRLEQLRLERFVSRARLGAYCWPEHKPPPTDGAVIRGAMAEALYRSDFGKLPRTLASTSSAPFKEAAASSPDAAAACVVANNPAGVDELLRRLPGTPDEKVAMAALEGSFNACGQRQRWGAVLTRGALAQALYARARGWGTATAQLESR